MTNSNAVQIQVQLEPSAIKAGVKEAGGLLESLERIAVSLANALNEALNPELGGLYNMQASFSSIANSMDAVTGKMTELVTQMAQQKEEGFSLLSGVDGFNTLADGLNNLDGISEKINQGLEKAAEHNENFNILKALMPETLERFQSLAGGISSAFDNINLAMNGTTLIWGVVIGAIIAGIVLLIQNWDTVSAAVVAGWNWICDCLSSAADWFYETVVQPIASFLGDAMDWISTKIQAGFAFVQSIFAGINTFLQGVFAKDWTEQFGAFGNVLNAFFANVENAWNAVKSIFSGIVSFVKNVFAGDWGAAWDSIVGVFKGIWDYLFSEALLRSRVSES